MVTKVKKRVTIAEVVENQRKINADLYNLILQAADDNTLRTKVNKAHDRISHMVDFVNEINQRNMMALSSLGERITELEQDDGMMVFVAGMLFAVLVVGIVLMATGVV